MKIAQFRRLRCPNCGGYPFSFVGMARQCWACGWLWDPRPAGREIVGYREEGAA